MKQIKCQPSSIKTGAMFLAATAILAFSAQGVFAQSNDFFSSTQSADLRASAATPEAPGFDPCRGGTAGAGGSSCTGAGANKPLLDPINLGDTATNTAGLFAKLGPGAVTDNMFGVVERPANPQQCTTGGGTFGSNLLNCGEGKWDPSFQGQTIPPLGGAGGAILTSAMATNTPIDMDSGAGTAAHMHSRVENGFVWNPTASDVPVPVNLVGLTPIATTPAAQNCTGVTAGSGAARVCGQFFMNQDTALSATTSSVVNLSASWNTRADTTTDGAMLGAPVVAWESHIVQSEFIGGGTFDQTLQGSFTYNGSATSPATFPSVQYPNGESFTNRSGGPGVIVETVPN